MMGAKKKGGKKPRVPEASLADKYDLYQRSVQNPPHEVALFRRVFRDAYGRRAQTLREDFGGTFQVACQWVKGDPTAEAWAVDLDPEPLEWGMNRNLSSLSAAQQARVHPVLGDVRDDITPPVDVVAAMNFSYFIFKTRAALRAYFESAWRHLNDEGVMVLDIFGGSEVFEDERQEPHTIDDEFEYIWDQNLFDPITHDYRFFIHFAFNDGSRLDRAFRYDWRLWSIPELRELLEEAGFSKSSVYWESTDQKTGEGNGQYRRRERADADPAWISYIVALK